MERKTFKALFVTKEGKKEPARAEVREFTLDDIPPIHVKGKTVLVKVLYSTINFKDGMAVLGKPGIVPKYPIVPGMDLSGIIMEGPRKGEKVVSTGWGVGEFCWGGYSQYARIKPEWLQPLPPSLPPKYAMAVGTAGLTAGLCIIKLLDFGLRPSDGPVLVTGASGGVGSISICILSNLGFEVVASTGKREEYVKSLGASKVIGRFQGKVRRLGKAKWAGCVDSVGGPTLAMVLSQTKRRGVVTAVGLAQSGDLPAYVHPFILRGISLLGVEGVTECMSNRSRAWSLISNCITAEQYEKMSTVHPLHEVPQLSEDILQGKIQGRLVIDLQNQSNL